MSLRQEWCAGLILGPGGGADDTSDWSRDSFQELAEERIRVDPKGYPCTRFEKAK